MQNIVTYSLVFIDESGRASSSVFLNQTGSLDTRPCGSEAGPSISMTRSKHSVFIEQTKLYVANPFSFSFSFSFSSVVRIDEENEGNEENHLTHHLLGPAP